MYEQMGESAHARQGRLARQLAAKLRAENKRLREETKAQISEIYVTTGRVEKTFAKMKADGPWRSNRIPELFGRVYNDIVTEEMWEIIKKWKDPIVNFRRLRSCIINDVKKVKPEIF